MLDDLARRAITESDNAAAAELFVQIETGKGGLAAASSYVGRELTVAGDSKTVVSTTTFDSQFSTYGQTQWSLSGGTQFYRELALNCLPPRRATTRVLELMAEITSSQRWGIGAIAWSHVTSLRFKGGWGPDQDGRYVVRQFGIIESAGRHGLVVGLIARPNNGLFQTGIEVLDELAAAVSQSVRISASPTYAPCK